ncbi:syntaxin-2 isoform X1 [Carassius auratus]|uniref:Syntaxin-2 isoform X1 n=1 Tax=Carassius auratus TaxID=7957 RepID=A0A6P6M3T0_CARAU|nr:syntaxin-2-like isoform X1 [Carassius auratus]
MKDRLGDLTALCHDIIIIAPVESSGFLEEFLLKVNEVQQLIERISLSVEEVKLRHSTLLTEINPPNYVREELEQFSRDIKQTADLIKVKLKDLEGKFSENENANSSSVYCRIQSTQHTVLSLRFAEIMNMYNQELLSFRTRSKDWIQRQLEISGKIITEEETEVLLQSNNPAVFTSNINSGSCITGQALNDIELRHKDILYLEASIRELHSMFIDIAMLVNSQGEMANNIAKTVMKAENYVDQGKENMVKAVDYKKSWRIRLPLFKSKAKPATSKGS